MLLFIHPKTPRITEIIVPSRTRGAFMSNHAQTQHSRAALALMDQPTAELYREIFTHSSDAIAIIDPEGHYLEQNAAHRSLMGYTDEELQGKTPAIHLGEEMFSQIARALSEKGEYRGEITSHT